MTLFIVIAAVTLLTVLIAAFKVQPFVAFVIVSILAAVMLGLPLERIPASVEKGVGDMLGSLAILIVLGAMFGKLVADSGAAERIAGSMIGAFGTRRITLAMAATGFLIGIPLFYNVGFVLLVPLIFTLAYQARLPVIYTGIPMLSGLSIAHGFLPPHPSPAALVTQFGADMGLTLIYGLIVGVPTLLIAGPLLATRLRGIVATPAASFRPQEEPVGDRVLPGRFVSFMCAFMPVMLIAGATILAYAPGWNNETLATIRFVGNPTIVMLVSLIFAIFTIGRKQTATQMAEGGASAIRDIAPILLIVAGAGALKQVFVDGGVNAELGTLLASLPVPPLVLGWLMATVIRIALGSATVAGLTAAGLVQPLIGAAGVDPQLMVLAIGAGSLMCSHVNDSGFWMFKEYFGLSLSDTFRSWSLMETLVGVFGLIFVLVLDMMI